MNNSKPINRLSARNPWEEIILQVSNPPLRIDVVFDEDESAGSAEVLIKNFVSDYQCDTQLFHFDKLDVSGLGIAAARSIADTDILVFAARGDRLLPSHIRFWLGLCLGLRDKGKAGALVALITNVGAAPGLHFSILEYLETMAIVGGVAFFSQELAVSEKAESDLSSLVRG
jgi:hypothetical protein